MGRVESWTGSVNAPFLGIVRGHDSRETARRVRVARNLPVFWTVVGGRLSNEARRGLAMRPLRDSTNTDAEWPRSHRFAQPTSSHSYSPLPHLRASTPVGVNLRCEAAALISAGSSSGTTQLGIERIGTHCLQRRGVRIDHVDAGRIQGTQRLV